MNFRKITAAAATAAMLVSMLGASVFADEGDAAQSITENEILYQNTFSNWDSDGWNDTRTAPGMVLANADLTGQNKVFLTNLKPYTEEDGNKSALMWREGNSGFTYQWYEQDRNGAFDVIPFNKVINDGKIYVSMDFYVPEYTWNNTEGRYYGEDDMTGNANTDNVKKSNGVNVISIFNTSTVDYNVNYGGTDWTYKATGEDLNSFIAADSEENHTEVADYRSNHQSQLASLNFDPNSFTVQTGAFARIQHNANKEGGATNKWTECKKEMWHKLQIIVDCDTTVKSADGMWEGNPVKIYIDDVLYHGNASTAKFVSDNVSGYKGIGIYRRGWERPGVRYDNIYVSHYTGDTKGPAPIVTVSDDASHISAALSEYVKDKPSVDGFVIKNVSTGEIISDYTATERENEYTFDFSQPLQNGKYKIYHKSAVGAITEQINTDGTTFFVNNGGEPIFDKATVYDYKNQAEAVSDDERSSDGSRIMNVSARAKKIKVSFSESMQDKAVENDIYLTDSEGNTVNAAYTADGKDVNISLDGWLTPGEKYTLCVDENNLITQGGGNIVLEVKDENICVLFDEKFEAGRVRAVMSGSVFKSNSGEQKNTMLLASYAKRTDDSGNEFLELLDAKWQKLDATGQGLFNGSVVMQVSEEADLVRGYVFNEQTGRLMTTNYFEKLLNE